MAARKSTAAGEVEVKEERYTLSQLLAAEKFSNRKDLLKALLSDERQYSISEVEQKIEKFMKGRVK